jgi:MFS family permease
MIVSDLVTLENRGKYQGILGACVGLGNTIGPFLAALFVEKWRGWRGLFWLISPMAVLSGVIVAITLPPSKVSGDLRTKFKVIDYYGVISSSAAILLLLIPISGGGVYFEW